MRCCHFVHVDVAPCQKVRLKFACLTIQSPLVNSVPWYSMTGCTGVDPPTVQSYNPFRGLPLICATPASTHQMNERSIANTG